MSRSKLQHVIRGCVRHILGALTPWSPLLNPADGYSIILGVPWALRHVLDVNLDFIERCDRDRLLDLHIVVDRPLKPGMREFAQETIESHPSLPIKPQWHAPLAGRIAERVNVSTFYCGLNYVTALSTNRARAMVLHDFDLYPLRPDYFEALAGRILDDGLRFAGLEHTHYDGLTDDDNVFGTWGLAIDAAWLRNHVRPADILHRHATLPDGRQTMLDPFSWLQLHEPNRGDLPGLSRTDVCHVTNLCSTYLRLKGGKASTIAWRVHYLVYLESLSANDVSRLDTLADEMDSSDGTVVYYDGEAVQCRGMDWTCANILEREVTQMELASFGDTRPPAARFIAAARKFFERCSPEAPPSCNQAAS